MKKITTAIQNVNQNNSSIVLAYGPAGLSESNGAFSIHAVINKKLHSIKCFGFKNFFIRINYLVNY